MAVEGQKVILVTGGSGLVGKGIQEVVARDPVDGEKWKEPQDLEKARKGCAQKI